MDPTEEQQNLELLLNKNTHPERNRKPDPEAIFRSRKTTVICEAVTLFIIFLLSWMNVIAFLAGLSDGITERFKNSLTYNNSINGIEEAHTAEFLRRLEEAFQRDYIGPPASCWCPNSWFRSRGRCYYFSKAEGNWISSRNNCSSLAASLAGIENLQELASLLPYPGKLDHWIGLRKDIDEVWKWVDGTKFDRRFEIRGGADCAYLDEELKVSSSSCSTQRKWICSKLHIPPDGEEHAVGGNTNLME